MSIIDDKSDIDQKLFSRPQPKRARNFRKSRANTVLPYFISYDSFFDPNNELKFDEKNDQKIDEKIDEKSEKIDEKSQKSDEKIEKIDEKVEKKIDEKIEEKSEKIDEKIDEKVKKLEIKINRSDKKFQKSVLIQQFDMMKLIFFSLKCDCVEGIFRKSPDVTEYEIALEAVRDLNLDRKCFKNVHVVASCIKSWVSNMGFHDEKGRKKGIFSRNNDRKKRIFGFLETRDIDQKYFFDHFDSIINTLDYEKKYVFYNLLKLLHKVSQNEKNLMNSRNLSIVTTPVIFFLEKRKILNETTLNELFAIVENLIENFPFFKLNQS